MQEMSEGANAVDVAREPFYHFMKMPSVETKPVKVMVSFPKNILEQIIKKQKQWGLRAQSSLLMVP